MIRLTQRGALVLGAAAVFFGTGHWAGSPLFLALAGASVGAVAAALTLASRRPRVRVAREVYPDRVERGRPAFAKLLVHNTVGRRQAGFIAGDRVGTGFQAVTVRPLAPFGQAEQHYDLPTDRRGRHQVGPLTLDRVDPLGLGRGRVTTGETATLWVHPRVHPMRALSGGHPRHHHEGAGTDDALRGSFDLREVREYTFGDEMRHLHWKATARTGKLMVREYADPDQPRFTALLDTRREVLDGPLFEESVDVAASLVAAAAGAGHRCRLVTSCGLDVATAGGPSAVRRLLDELTLLAPAPGVSLPLVPGPLSRAGGGGLAVITAATSPADRASLAALRSRYSAFVVVVLGGAVAQAVPGAKVVPAVDAADAAKRWNVVVPR
ncbi:DUF58 domain-containing protein [Amycolatopsis sp. H20-H5]|uniref:DUF58 domain-containing protein n=1 Tax=Amycolatopsis sp. H20-H5 TaxID=3046309 RepID=UPI002DB74374|nr:DUF58 domain-containing protein [Amycolatopsis sp. H20-H5]MEC3982642.1 DUF58 domain-containing protein [Amycolatopsis sp. H20-H5]